MSLTLPEARARAAVVSQVAYAVELDLTSTTDFTSRTVVSFTCAGPDTFLELALAQDLRVAVDGTPVEAAYDGERIALTGLTPGRPVQVVVEARLPYVTDGDGMHTFTDPVDGERYVSAYTGMDVAHKVIACFDQVDLKGPVTLTVTADPAWTVVAIGEVVDSIDGVTRFAPTATIPITLFVVCAGPWHSVRWQHDGLDFAWHARRSLAAELDRDAEELQRTTEACFDHYAGIFDEPYPFGAYDQVFVPGLNWGAMENPGCVTFRDEWLPRGRISQTDREVRAMVIAHEMAHMWFGDLVTMTWWEDIWLQESFADYMGFRVSEAIGFSATRTAFEAGQKAFAYAADTRRSSHPIAPRPEDVADADAALANADQITYGKGNAVLRQLVVWLGDEAFLAGVNAYLTRHRFGNATLDDFVDALDAATDRDVRAWVQAWLRTTGFDTLRMSRSEAGVPVLTREGTRPHRVTVTGYDAGGDGTGVPAVRQVVDVGDGPVSLPDLVDRLVVPDSGGDSFARLWLDAQSWAAVTAGLSGLPDEVTRAVLWTSTLDHVLAGELQAADWLGLIAGQLPQEMSATIVHWVLSHTATTILARKLPAGEAASAVDGVAAACSAGLASRPPAQVALELSRGLAWSTRDTARLGSWLDSDRTDGGLELDPSLRWSILHRLCELGVDADIEAESARDPSGAPEGAATARAALPTEAAKAEAWAAMSEDPEVSNRMFGAHAAGLWSVEQAELAAPYVSSYLRLGPGLARARGQAFGQTVGWAFPALRLTDPQLDELREALTGDVPTVLRRYWEDRLDDLTTGG